MENLYTSRLTIMPCSVELCNAILSKDIEKLNIISGAEPAEGWPIKDALNFFPVYLNRLKIDPYVFGWGAWITILKNEKKIVGDLGFLGKPSIYGTVEIGYSIAPDFRGNGYAYESAQALIEWAFLNKRVESVIARCEPGNKASIRVLEKIGMSPVDNKKGLLIWEMLKKKPDVSK
jgi:[ribosomal protein S5]-alanine N-acetyltransferase